MPTFRQSPDDVLAAFAASGMYPVGEGPPVRMPGGEAELVKADRKRERLTAPQFAPALRVWEGSRLIVVVPVETRSESNLRDWRARSRRSGAAWKAVRAAMCVRNLAGFQNAVRQGKPVHVTLTRLGGRKLDRGNLPHALKGVEDAVAYLVGVDDGSPLWEVSYEQEPGGLTGVRIELQ